MNTNKEKAERTYDPCLAPIFSFLFLSVLIRVHLWIPEFP